MNIGNCVVWASVMLAAGSFATGGVAKEAKSPGFRISADKLEHPADNHLKAAGNVSFRIDDIEIKSDEMDVLISNDEIKLIDGKFKAVIQK